MKLALEPSPLEKLQQVQGGGAGFGTAGLEQIVANVIAAFLSIAGVVLITLIVYGGVIWMKARGNEKEVERAQNILTNAVIGLIITLAAYAISRFVVCSLLKATGAALCP
jgi:cbb3-type cytochrome oxidase subunit 3